MQGDVFEGVAIPNAREHRAILLMTHPCTMRGAAGQLKPVLQAAPLVEYQAVPLDQWATGHLRVFPLPDLDDGAPCAALLEQVGLFRTEELDINRRIATLSEDGILLLQQRFVMCLTRARISLPRLDEASRHVLEEAELLEAWNETLAQPRVNAGEDRDTVLNEEAEQFDAFLRTGDPELRSGLKAAAGRAAVRRAVRQEIVARSS